MTQASQDIAKQFANAAVNKKNWGAVAYNVLSEGLSGDGVSDDTAKLQALINKAISANRRTILFPHGQYYVTALTNADQVDFVGDNSSFVGGYTGTISDLGGFAELMADFTQLDADYNTRVIKPTQEIPPPTGLGYTPPFTIPFIKNDGKAAVTGFDVANLAPTGKKYYVDINVGSDAADGLTPNTPLKSIYAAVAKSDVVEVIVAAGVYPRTNAMNGVTNGKNISIKAEGGRAVISTHDSLTWTVSATYTYTYEATRSAVGCVVDTTILDKNGDYTALTLQTSIANVNANPGSYYADGTKVYVRTRDSRVVTNAVRVYTTVNNLKNVGNFTTYLENIDLEGGPAPLRIENSASSDTTKIYAKNSTFKYAASDNAVRVIGADAIFQDCIAAQGFADGFNYHIQNSHAVIAVEINCIGRTNGIRDGGATNNGSTMHDGGTIVRVNGKYHGNSGPNVADVLDSKSWNVAVESYGSLITSTQGVNFYIDGDMWLDSCVSYSSPYDLTADGNLKIRNLLTEGSNIVLSGSIAPY